MDQHKESQVSRTEKGKAAEKESGPCQLFINCL